MVATHWNNNKLNWLVYLFVYCYKSISICFMNLKQEDQVTRNYKKNKAPFLQPYEGWGFLLMQAWN